MKILDKILEFRSFRNLSLPFIIGFLFLNLANTQDGGQNARTRIAAMRSMHEQFTFRIDPHIGATNDWSQTPDGAYYSNKAPGPMLYGFPVFLILDRLHMLKEGARRDANGLRQFPDYLQMTGTSLLMQAVPFAILAAYLVHILSGLGASLFTQAFVLFAVLFGNTAAIYMASYFGHGITAFFTLAALVAMLERRYMLLSFCFGSALLCDYGVGMQVPSVALALGYILFSLPRDRRAHELRSISKGVVLGALVPGVLWVWYHTMAFGNPFYIANKFQNPAFLDMKDQAVQLWGIFSLPRLEVLWALLFGAERGIWVTQPWVLLAIPFGLFYAWRGVAREAAVFCVVGLAGLIFMNASFGGWNGGGAAGPRYLSHIFPAFALWIGLFLDRMPRVVISGFWLSLGFAVLYRSLVYNSTTEAAFAPLWSLYLSELAKASWTPIFRVYLFWIVLTICGVVSWRRSQIT